MGSKKRPEASPVLERVLDKDVPSLMLVDYVPPGTRPSRLVGGAYDPYERIPTGNTVRVKRPSIDLRQLSTWIKTKRDVDTLREGDTSAKGKSRTR